MPLVLLLVLSCGTLQQPARDGVAVATVPGTGAIEGPVIVEGSKPPMPVRRARVTLTGERRGQEITEDSLAGNPQETSHVPRHSFARRKRVCYGALESLIER